MTRHRTYGEPPYRVALLHGGPGAAGEMAPVARELAGERGVLEPLQTARTLRGQVRELRAVLRREAEVPAAVVGFSWGAWLGYILAAEHPGLVRKLVLVGSGPFEEGHAESILEARWDRLDEGERREVDELSRVLEGPGPGDRDAALARLGELFTRADAYDPLEGAGAEVDVSHAVFQGVWRQAGGMRASGRLLELGRRIRCPVVAIHGDQDPHPDEGVRQPLSRVLDDFRFVLLERCGHRPWMERWAREEFFRVLRGEL